MASVDKVVVTNFGVLEKKYGLRGLESIEASLVLLVTVDLARGVETRVVSVDDHDDMRSLGGKAVTSATNPSQNKRAIDAIYKALTPDYLMILGAIDVIPHQPLNNLLYVPDPDEDDDRFAYGDLPYACEAAPSRDTTKFLGPTRVVGRLPDMTGGTDVAYLVGLIDAAAAWEPSTRREMSKCFPISARTWMGSTRLSVSKMFGDGDIVQVVPTDAPPWTAAQLQSPMIFVNCHGSKNSSVFVGESNEEDPDVHTYPEALTSDHLRGTIRRGAVMAAECCYGGQLFPLSRRAPTAGICNTFLESGGYGVFASTTIAYGTSRANTYADLICQFFMTKVLNGASLGRAALEARQDFVREYSALDPTALKTLAQFNLYGDPSIHPVKLASGRKTLRMSDMRAVEGDAPQADRADRRERRLKLANAGAALQATSPKIVEVAPRGDVLARMNDSLGRDGFWIGKSQTFAIRRPRARLRGAHALPPETTEAFHVVIGRARTEERAAQPPSGVKTIVVRVAKEVDGQLVSVTEAESR